MSSSNTNFRNLTIEQQRLLSMYISQYEQTNNHIDLLFNMLDEIRQNIVNITQTRHNRHNRHNRHTNNNNNNNNRNLNSMFNPILNNRYNFFNNEDRIPIDTYYNGFNMFTNRNRNNYDFLQNSELTSLLNTFLNTRVIVRPTTEQIETATRLIRYRDIENPLAEFCPISLEEFNDDDEVRQILQCGHIFHQNQFQQWFDTNSRCPICRYDIRNYIPLNNNNNDQTSRQSTSEANEQNVRDQTSRQSNRNNLDTSSTLPISNIELLRNPISNQIEQFSFDINDPSFTNIFLDQITRNILNNLYTHNDNNNNNNNDNNSNGRIMIDPSNNLFY
jgi:hypothetical protein